MAGGNTCLTVVRGTALVSSSGFHVGTKDSYLTKDSFKGLDSVHSTVVCHCVMQVRTEANENISTVSPKNTRFLKLLTRHVYPVPPANTLLRPAFKTSLIIPSVDVHVTYLQH